MRRRTAGALAATCFGLTAVLSSAIALGALTVVTTQGVSMHPTYYAGDLVLVVPARSYPVGQIVAYRDHLHHLIVLHRIVGTDPIGYRLKGDNNASVDAVHPQQSDVIGRAVLHVPHAGGWLHRALSPLPLTVLAVALALGGSARIRSRRRRQPMSRHASRTWSTVPALHESGRRLATGAAVVGVLGLALGALTWTTSVVTHRPGAAPPVGVMTFSYHAEVGHTAAYDSSTVQAPDPVFRRLTTTVAVGIDYRGRPGSITVDAQLSTPSGWHSTVPLAPRRQVTTGHYEDSVRLDLPELERRAHAAAAVNGMPAGQISVAVTAAVTRADGTTFAPSLRLALTPLALTLVDPTSLTANMPATAGDRTDTVPASRRLLGRDLPIADGRIASVVLVLSSALTGLLLLVAARRNAPIDESAAIQRRHASVLMSVHPMPSPAGQPVVDVTAFLDLVTLAERYGLPVLHWTRSNITTFVVHDQQTDYRYRTGTDPSPVTPHLTTTGAAR